MSINPTITSNSATSAMELAYSTIVQVTCGLCRPHSGENVFIVINSYLEVDQSISNVNCDYTYDNSIVKTII